MFDARTQVLTDTGWVSVAELHTHRIANFDPETGILEGFFQPRNYHAHHHTGTMLCLDGTVSLCVSPDHMLYASRNSTQDRRRHPVYELQQANHALYGRYRDKVLSDTAFRVRKAGQGTQLTGTTFHPFPELDTDAFARLLGFTASDGYARACRQNSLDFHLRKARKIDYLRDLCATMPVPLIEQSQYQVRYPGLGAWMADTLYTPDRQKTLPDAVFRLSGATLDGVLDGLRNGDGYTHTPERWEYVTVSRELAERIQAIGVIAGIPFSCYARDGCYRLYTLGYEAQPHINDSRSSGNHTRACMWQGRVYGFESITGLIAIRRDAKTLLIGSH